MNDKYEFTGETKKFDGATLHRIRALKDFGYVKNGDVGGWIENEENLSVYDNAWIYGNGEVCENGALNLRQITPEQAKEFYEKNRGERKDEQGL